MIAILEGEVTEISEESVVLFINGIGYEVFVAHPENFVPTKKYSLYIYENRKENELSLYGFKSKSEKAIFDLIVKKVSGVGPKTAIGIFRVFTKEKLIQVIDSGDYKAFKPVPGIGEKTAKRIVIELGGEIKEEEKKVESEKIKLVRSALTSLGYSVQEINRVLKEISEENTVENAVRKAIQLLNNAE
jgi:Holliday junction DNA helicase RuvA